MSQPRRRFSLLTVSITAHLALFAGVFVSGVWKIDRLDADRSSISLAVMSPPAPSGGPPSLPEVKLPHKKHVTHDLTQVVPKQPEELPTVALVEPNPGGGEGSGSGSGTNPLGPPDGPPGACLTPPCGTDARTPQPPPQPLPVERPKTALLSPPMLKGLRYGGKTEIVPSDNVKMQMMRDDHLRSTAAFKICLSETGSISSVTMAASTHYDDYDRALLDGIRGWLYHPYQVGGQGVPACGMVSFVYTIK